MRRILAAAAMLAALPAPALAQAWQCRVPPQISVPAPERADGPVRVARPERYTLALSWSPEFCRTRKGDPRHALQCSGSMGRFGFVLHGLWPETDGAPPQWCPSRLTPDAQVLRRNLCMTPSAELLAHEWAKHGSCMSPSPAGYFAAGQALFGSIGFPDMARLSRQQGLSAGAVRDALIAANPSLDRSMFRLSLSDSGWLREVHVCYGADFMPQRCPKGRAGPADKVPVKIWRSF